MRLASIDTSHGPRPALVIGAEALDLVACGNTVPEARGLPSTLRAILEAGDSALSKLRRVQDLLLRADEAIQAPLRAEGALKPLSDVRQLAPLYDTRMILATGMNHRRHLHEMGIEIPATPIAFIKSTQAVIGPDEAIVLPRLHDSLVDWEAEFCAVIGRPCHNVSAEEAEQYVAGYTMINDVSARDWVTPFNTMHGMAAINAYELNLLGKQFPTFCPMGPVVVTKDELADPRKVAFELSVSGELMQTANTDDLVFDVATIIAYYSQFYALQPGDVVTTGSPGGVGFARKPRRMLKAGDVVSISADVIGTMNNPVVSQAA